ncbi:MAG: hypothetical protein CMP21_01475 [Rickettsiales bacterium]|nr:hypothetical protein [Rickettsiales bacterium]|tara:strand:+ start:9444 stop:10211 length:768 start_codon:yes stop_codon:yes gene_type:complete
MLNDMFLMLGFCVLIGGCFGSFANMLIYRLCSEQSLLSARSICPHCQSKLRLRDLIPIVSFLCLRGCCGSCKKPILKRYLLVELLTPILFFFFLYPSSFMTFNSHYLIFGYIILILFFTDLESYLLPLPLTSALVVLGIVVSFLDSILFSRLMVSLLIAMALLSFRYIFNRIYKQDTFGLGDIILLVAIALNFGWQICVSSFYCAVILGGCYSLVLILLKKRSRKDMIPFGPFIIIGILCSFKFLEIAVPFLLFT